MIEPWNIRQEDSRPVDSLPTFIIFCEDEVCEPIYLKFFETPLIKVNIIKGQKSKIENVINAITHCLQEKVMKYEGNELKPIVEEIKIWCVFDRDVAILDTCESKANSTFNESIKMAENNGLRVAWSNDSFELWILLHFEDIDSSVADNKSRNTYYDRLTTIFKEKSNPNLDLRKALSHNNFSYKKDLKKSSNFRNIVREELIDETRTREAFKRAIELEKLHSLGTKPNNEKSPCTMIHHLVCELLQIGKKELKVSLTT